MNAMHGAKDALIDGQQGVGGANGGVVGRCTAVVKLMAEAARIIGATGMFLLVAQHSAHFLANGMFIFEHMLHSHIFPADFAGVGVGVGAIALWCVWRSA